MSYQGVRPLVPTSSLRDGDVAVIAESPCPHWVGRRLLVIWNQGGDTLSVVPATRLNRRDRRFEGWSAHYGRTLWRVVGRDTGR